MEAILYVLSKNRLMNITLIESLVHHQAEVLYFDGINVLLLDRSSQMLLLSLNGHTKNHEEIYLLMKDRDVLLVQSQYVDELTTSLPLSVKAYYHQACCQKVNDYSFKNVELVPLQRQDYWQCAAVFPEQDNDYLRERFEKGHLWKGIFEDKLIGYIGEHDDGSIGLLKVLEDYRQHGYGQALLAQMSKFYLQQRRLPRSQIEVSHQVSIKLHQKVGYDISEQHVAFLVRRDKR